MIKTPSKTIVEYIWIGGRNEIRSKTRVFNSFLPFDVSCILDWNYDGSSTWQADSNGDTEIILKPCSLFKDPFRLIEDGTCYLVLCDTYNTNGEPTLSNHRYKANVLFDNLNEQEPWFGLEQEFFFSHYGKLEINEDLNKEGYHYCGTTQTSNERIILEKHLRMCIESGIKISGINAEVAKGQWEFQIGPCEGIQAGDHLIVARYILERLAEQFQCTINYLPKPTSNVNGSGCHINFSTIGTRNENGIEIIYDYIKRLEKMHKEHIAVYGENNHLRLTGLHETSSVDKFSWGIGTRNTSIRIPNQTFKNKCGYFEDRRPAANLDPYLATSMLFRTCCFL
jgi:glutamine synthetase